MSLKYEPASEPLHISLCGDLAVGVAEVGVGGGRHALDVLILLLGSRVAPERGVFVIWC